MEAFIMFLPLATLAVIWLYVVGNRQHRRAITTIAQKSFLIARQGGQSPRAYIPTPKEGIVWEEDRKKGILLAQHNKRQVLILGKLGGMEGEYPTWLSENEKQRKEIFHSMESAMEAGEQFLKGG